MKYLKIVAFIFFLTPVHAQIAHLLQNDSITWMAEWNADYLIDDFDATDTILNNGLGLIKYLQKEEGKFYSVKSFFTSHLWEAIKSNKISVFSDSILSKKIKNEATFYLGRARRIYNDEPELDPTSYLTGCFIPMPLSPDDVKFYRTRQIVYYNAVKAQFQLQILAIAPLINGYNEELKIDELKPLFWFKPEMAKPNISSEDIVWAQKVFTKANSLKVLKAQVLKNSMGDTLIRHFFQCFEKDMTIPFWGFVEDDYILQKLSKQERRKLINRTDTVNIINSNTYEVEEKAIRESHLTYEDIKSIRFYEEWFWDDKQKKLFIYLKSAAAAVAIKNEVGEWLYDTALFHRKTDD